MGMQCEYKSGFSRERIIFGRIRVLSLLVFERSYTFQTFENYKNPTVAGFMQTNVTHPG